MEIKTFLSLNCPKCNEEQFKGQKSHDVLEKPLKMVNYLCTVMWRPYMKIYEKNTRNPRVLITHRLGL